MCPKSAIKDRLMRRPAGMAAIVVASVVAIPTIPRPKAGLMRMTLMEKESVVSSMIGRDPLGTNVR
jgi:hypothetical protein